jgi:hypothetical protein
LKLSGNLPPKKEYTKEDLASAMETLALLMLRIRDGKVRGIVRNGVLKKLTDGERAASLHPPLSLTR